MGRQRKRKRSTHNVFCCRCCEAVAAAALTDGGCRALLASERAVVALLRPGAAHKSN